jgi:hypothetical protein
MIATKSFTLKDSACFPSTCSDNEIQKFIGEKFGIDLLDEPITCYTSESDSFGAIDSVTM